MKSATAADTEGQQVRTATDSVFETILADIVRGTYPPGSRLPAERELSRRLGASRPTLREALRRLAAWHLVDARRGSGIVVRERRDWSLEVLPAYLRYGGAADQPGTTQVLADMLALRRIMYFDIIRLVCDRIPAGGTAAARRAAARAWALRDDGVAYAAADLDVTRGLVEAAEFLPALWLVNRLGSVYDEIVRSVSSIVRPPDEYLEVHERLFDALERHDADTALGTLQRYFEAHDRRILSFLEAMA